ncbi:hypothetical protein HY630_02340 [Candidatus Uhrbacteria bacterium]|nr:hypothetical protein [Candidatus Uhrbacteria bacterium]
MAIESKMVRGPIGARPGPEQKKSGSWRWGIGIIVIVLCGAAAWYFWMGPGAASTEQTPIASGDYQAVFLDNGQVYFGKLDRSRDEFLTLTDVFYLQSGVAVEQTSNLSLTKLGSEAHGPEDQMLINREHVLFIEDMKNDSKVVQAIQQYKTSKP